MMNGSLWGLPFQRCTVHMTTVAPPSHGQLRGGKGQHHPGRRWHFLSASNRGCCRRVCVFSKLDSTNGLGKLLLLLLLPLGGGREEGSGPAAVKGGGPATSWFSQSGSHSWNVAGSLSERKKKKTLNNLDSCYHFYFIAFWDLLLWS